MSKIYFPVLTNHSALKFAKYDDQIVGLQQLEGYTTAALAVNKQMDILSFTTQDDLIADGEQDNTDHVDGIFLKTVYYVVDDQLNRLDFDTYSSSLRLNSEEGSDRRLKMVFSDETAGPLTILVDTQTGVLSSVACSDSKIIGFELGVTRGNANRRPVQPVEESNTPMKATYKAFLLSAPENCKNIPGGEMFVQQLKELFESTIATSGMNSGLTVEVQEEMTIATSVMRERKVVCRQWSDQ